MHNIAKGIQEKESRRVAYREDKSHVVGRLKQPTVIWGDLRVGFIHTCMC